MGKEKSYFLDISTLGELNYTGIPKITLELAKHIRDRDDVYFFWYDYIVPQEIIDSIIKSESGAILGAIAANLIDFEPLISAVRRTPTSVGIFPNVATTQIFTKTAQIICDVSYIVVPEHHHIENVLHHGTTILRDVEAADALICISQSTADDVLAYLQVPEEKVSVIKIGVDAPTPPIQNRGGIEDFVLVLGTIEPRKNIDIILSYLQRNKSLLNEYAFLFCGRDGWVIAFDELIEKYDLEDEVVSGRIVRIDFASEALKWDLLSRARLLIFPSFYEGYGLPVIEALAVGTPVLASWSSSIPEVGGDLVSYFDPTDAGDFQAAFDSALTRDLRNSPEWREQASHLVENNSWRVFCEGVMKLCQGL